MSALAGLNKTPNGVVLGLVQLQLPVVKTRGDLAAQTEYIVAMVGKARRNMPTMDLVVFPEYALLGLSMEDEIITAEVRPDLLCEARKHRSVENGVYQLDHRGFTEVAGGAHACPYTYMRDLVADRCASPWESEVLHTDGASCSPDKPLRAYGERLPQAAE